MTSLEIQKAKKTLPPIKDWQNWTRKQKRLDEELSCREMIISCSALMPASVAATGLPPISVTFMPKADLLISSPKTMKKATVHHGAYRDSEGGVYASVEW